MIESFDLSLIMSRLNLGWTPQFPTYEEVFPSQWANNSQVEDRHRRITQRIQKWPYDEDNEVIIILLVIIIIINYFWLLVWPKNVADGLPDASLQYGLWKPEEQRHDRKSSIEIQFTSSTIFKVSRCSKRFCFCLHLTLGRKCLKKWPTKSFWKLRCCFPSQGNFGKWISCTWCEVDNSHFQVTL